MATVDCCRLYAFLTCDFTFQALFLMVLVHLLLGFVFVSPFISLSLHFILSVLYISLDRFTFLVLYRKYSMIVYPVFSYLNAFKNLLPFKESHTATYSILAKSLCYESLRSL